MTATLYPTFAQNMDVLRFAIAETLAQGVIVNGVELKRENCHIDVSQHNELEQFVCNINYGGGTYKLSTHIMNLKDYKFVPESAMKVFCSGLMRDIADEIRYRAEQDFVTHAIEAQGDCIGKYSPTKAKTGGALFAANYMLNTQFKGGGYAVLTLDVRSHWREELGFNLSGEVTRYTVEGEPVATLPLGSFTVDTCGILDIAGATQPWSDFETMFYEESRYVRA